ncbi:MAG: tRNA (adenosine(37)-N6)-threonylcarbamoyltransferase complex ATPase subunit type 1 TsaE [Patescibacteria group bacterium]|jgi:tRNA threonylcarbamoyladenosine biosynthesis protein TsaE
MSHITTHSPEETEILGARMSRTLQGGEVIGLQGALGAGKTVFVRGLLHALGVQSPVTSPTFTLAKSYTTKHKRIRSVVHIDAYRLEKPEELLATDVIDTWGRPDTATIIEWPERVAGITPKNIEYILIDRGKENLRFWVFAKQRQRMLTLLKK